MFAFLKPKTETIARFHNGCENIEVEVKGITIYKCREDGWLTLAFKCPQCHRQVFERAAKDARSDWQSVLPYRKVTGGDVVEVMLNGHQPQYLEVEYSPTDFELVERLQSLGVPLVEWSIGDGYPVDVGAATCYQARDERNSQLDELAPFRLRADLETVDWFDQLKQSVTG